MATAIVRGNMLGILPMGAGKSVCYRSLNRPGAVSCFVDLYRIGEAKGQDAVVVLAGRH